MEEPPDNAFVRAIGTSYQTFVQMASKSSTSVSTLYKWQKELPAKYVVNPVLLSDELRKLFGEGQFSVEVSHSVVPT